MRKCAYFIKNKCCAKIIAKICSKNIGITSKNIQNTQKQFTNVSDSANIQYIVL